MEYEHELSEMKAGSSNGDTCGWRETTTGNPCQNPVSEPDAYCYLHGEDGEIPDGHGPPEGNSGGKPGRSGPPGNTNAEGNPGGGPPEGNGNAVTHGVHASTGAMLDALEEWERDAFKGYFSYYHHEQGLDRVQAKSLALMATYEDRCGVELAESLHKTIYTEAGEMQVPKDTMMEAHRGYARERRLKEHYEGMSKHGAGSGGSSGHDNLDLLVNDGNQS